MPTKRLAGPFDVPGKWFRGCLHVHTTESDGGMPPDRLLAHYRMGGYDFVALTDHEMITDRTTASRPDFLVLPGIELDVDRTELGGSYHIVGIGIATGQAGGDGSEAPTAFVPERGLAAQEAINRIVAAGGIAIIAHPYWSGLTAADLLRLRGYSALEVFNTGCEGEVARGSSSVHWDELLTRGREIRAVASDDSHWPGFDSLHAWTVVRAAELSQPAIVEALRLGHYYASTGPEILSARLVGSQVEVECSPASAIALVCDARRGGRVGASRREPGVFATRQRLEQGFAGLDPWHPLTSARFHLRGDERYARVQVVDQLGRLAWTNPLFIQAEPD